MFWPISTNRRFSRASVPVVSPDLTSLPLHELHNSTVSGASDSISYVVGNIEIATTLAGPSSVWKLPCCMGYTIKRVSKNDYLFLVGFQIAICTGCVTKSPSIARHALQLFLRFCAALGRAASDCASIDRAMPDGLYLAALLRLTSNYPSESVALGAIWGTSVGMSISVAVCASTTPSMTLLGSEMDNLGGEATHACKF